VATVSLQHLSSWDFAAGHALVRAAGGVVVDENGQEMTYTADGQSSCLRIFGGGRAVVEELVPHAWDGISGSGFGEAAPPPSQAPVRAQPGKLVHVPEVLSRAHGCLLGQIAGDALGALVEFAPADRIARVYVDGGPHRLASGGPHDVIAGQPTDDSELALLLARSVVEHDGFSQEAAAGVYAGWFHGWTHSESPDTCAHRWCRPFDVGHTMRQALETISAADVRAGAAAVRARASANTDSQANGGLMRISPLGIWGATRDPGAVAAAARADAQLTHPHLVCQDASAVFAVTLAAAIRQGFDPQQTYDYAVAWIRAEDIVLPVRLALEAARQGPPANLETKQGWVLIALQNAFFQLLHAPTLEEAVVATVRRGGDTDTNAAICGALVGAVYGRDAIPGQWRRMILTCRPMPGQSMVKRPRPAMYWPADALVLTERLLACT
jgi:ADP-ribosylglycohydrolase